MDLILENIKPEQAHVFKKMAKILQIRTKIRNIELSEEDEDKALVFAMESDKNEGILSENEKEAFLSSLTK